MNSTYWKNKIMDTVYVNGVNEFWLGLSRTLPADDGSGVTESTAADYARAQITKFTTAAGGRVKNAESFWFPTPASAWFTETAPAVYWVLFDGPEASANVLSAGKLDSPQAIVADVPLSVLPEGLTITLFDYDPSN